MDKIRIRTNAIRIWHILNVTSVISVVELSYKLALDAEETTLAIGWLAHENKVFIEERQDAIYVSNGAEYMFSFG